MKSKIDLYKGDCLEVMKSIPDGSIDCVITDPPYQVTRCKWDIMIPFEPMWEQLNRIIKPNGAILLFGIEPFSTVLRMSNIENYKYDWYWNKNKPTGHFNSRKQPLKLIENISVFYKNQCKYFPQLRDKDKKHIRDPKKEYGQGMNNTYGKNKKPYMFNSGREIPLDKSYPVNLINFAQVGSFGGGRVHPTQKPVVLLEYLIKTYTNEGETVLDFTMGSGSTLVACLNTNRRGIGIELDDNYFEIAKERIENHKVERKLF